MGSLLQTPVSSGDKENVLKTLFDIFRPLFQKTERVFEPAEPRAKICCKSTRVPGTCYDLKVRLLLLIKPEFSTLPGFIHLYTVIISKQSSREKRSHFSVNSALTRPVFGVVGTETFSVFLMCSIEAFRTVEATLKHLMMLNKSVQPNDKHHVAVSHFNVFVNTIKFAMNLLSHQFA